MNKRKILETTNNQVITEEQLILLGATRGQAFMQWVERDGTQNAGYRQKIVPCWILIFQDSQSAKDLYYKPLLAEGENPHADADKLVHSGSSALPMGEDTIRSCSVISYREFMRHFEVVSIAENRLEIKLRILRTIELLNGTTELIPECSNMEEFLSCGSRKSYDRIGGGSRHFKVAVTERKKLLLVRKEDNGICWSFPSARDDSLAVGRHSVLSRSRSVACVLESDGTGITEYNEVFSISTWKTPVVMTIYYTVLRDYNTGCHIPWLVAIYPDFDGWYTVPVEGFDAEVLCCEVGPLKVTQEWSKERIEQ